MPNGDKDDTWHADYVADQASDPPEKDEPPEFWEGRTGKWFITYDPPPIPIRTCDWHFRHDDYDPTPWDSGGPPLDHRQGHAASWADCVTQIQEMEADMDDDQQRFEHEMGESK